MTRLRTCNHRLQIEICRYTIPKTPIHDRLRKNCSDNLVEDEIHLLLGCSKFNDLRRDYVTSCFNKNINRTNDISSSFIWLLSNEDNDVCKKIARFINLSFWLRTKP
jgi:Mg2+ and Co2+ transporter CorA